MALKGLGVKNIGRKSQAHDLLRQTIQGRIAEPMALNIFDVVVQAGNKVVAKRIGQVALNFPAGSIRAQTSAQATARVSRSAATLPENVREILTRPRKVGDPDAAVDPMTDPGVRDAVARATFQHLIGFQLTADQLKYNATR